MAERVRELGSPPRLEVGQQVEPAGVVGAVAEAAERNDAVRVLAATQRTGHQMCWVDPSLSAAHETRKAGDLLTLRVRGSDRTPGETRSALKRRSSPKRSSTDKRSLSLKGSATPHGHDARRFIVTRKPQASPACDSSATVFVAGHFAPCPVHPRSGMGVCAGRARSAPPRPRGSARLVAAVLGVWVAPRPGAACATRCDPGWCSAS